MPKCVTFEFGDLLNLNMKKQLLKFLFLVSIFIFSAFIYIYLIETRFIKIEEHKIESGFNSRFILISDLHLGYLKQKKYLEYVVTEINKQKDIEFIVINGDFIYGGISMKEQSYYDKLFQPLEDLQKPVYVVYGNHENGATGEKIVDILDITLIKYGANIIENNHIELNGISIVGLKDYWEEPEAYKYLNQVESEIGEGNIDLVITHNPDIVDFYDTSVRLTVAGHTHCGQIRVPYIYKFALPIVSEYEKGLHDTGNGKLFVSCGLGETGRIPLRLWNRPAIYVIETF